jgi:hypothetical protein
MQAFDPSVKLLQNVIFHYFETDFYGPINSEVLKLIELGVYCTIFYFKKFPLIHRLEFQ